MLILRFTIKFAHITVLIAIIACYSNSLSYAQGLNAPVGNPTANSGTGNARTDSDNFFLRNNVAGLSEIPLNNEEEASGKAIGAAKGSWRFLGALRAQYYKYEYDRRVFFSGVDTTRTEGSVITPNFAGEITYTSANHRFGFGIGTYQIINYSSRFNERDTTLPLNQRQGLSDVRLASTDIAIGGAVRLHRKFSVGAAFVFGRANFNLTEPLLFVPSVPNILEQFDGSKVSAPGLTIGVNYRPTNYLSLGTNYKSKRRYTLKGEFNNAQGLDENFNLIIVPSVNARTDVQIPTIAEGGLQVKPIKRLLLAADFRFYDNTASTDSFDFKFSSKLRFFHSQLGFISDIPQDVHQFNIGSKYSLNDKTNFSFGMTITSNGANEFPPFVDTGNVYAGGISRRINNHWFSINFATIRRNRPEDSKDNSLFNSKYRGRGFVISIGLRLNK